jgi:hypothetical protein
MRRIAVLSALVLLPAVVISAAEPAKSKKEAGKETRRLVGTWECVSERPPAGVRIVKHFTPTHFTCVHYDRATNVPKVTIGGTWTREGDNYKEKVDFATDGHKHLRGKEFAFTLVLTRGEFQLKAAKGSGIVVNETWKKVKAQDASANAAGPTGARPDAVPGQPTFFVQ